MFLNFGGIMAATNNVKVDSDFVSKVEEAVGVSTLAWDLVEPEELCSAVLTVAEKQKAQ
jgi:hypothetical protein